MLTEVLDLQQPESVSLVEEVKAVGEIQQSLDEYAMLNQYQHPVVEEEEVVNPYRFLIDPTGEDEYDR